MPTENQTALSLDELARKLPAPEPSAIAAIENAATVAQFVEIGRQIDSARVVTDEERLYGQAGEFWFNATEAQKATLVGFSPEYLAVGVHFALKLRAAEAAPDAGSPDKKVRDKALALAMKTAIPLRDQAVTLMVNVSGRDAVERLRVRTNAGTAETPADLANGLDALVDLGREALASPKPDVAARAKLARLTPAYLERLTTASSAIRAASSTASAPRAGTTGQGSLDHLDGMNIHVLHEIIRAFETAHDIDPTIPRLVPISTRRVLGKRTSSPVTPTPTPIPQPA